MIIKTREDRTREDRMEEKLDAIFQVLMDMMDDKFFIYLQVNIYGTEYVLRYSSEEDE